MLTCGLLGDFPALSAGPWLRLPMFGWDLCGMENGLQVVESAPVTDGRCQSAQTIIDQAQTLNMAPTRLSGGLATVSTLW